ncbi:MAG TPA: hypothetical protein VF223_09580 [Trebonia sp.]
MDLASYGVVAILDDNGTDWRPKEASHALVTVAVRDDGGGTLETGPRPGGGFCLTATVPVQARGAACR